MPPAAFAKPTRSSIYGWPKKRSVSPAPAAVHSAKSKFPATTMSTSARRSDDSPFHEDDYREEIEVYMHYMDNQSLASADLMDMQPELQWFMRPYLRSEEHTSELQSR
ncbi:MAG: hypothetical protein TREMPRED_005446 [Tremellales sp. Tagirdzhanova-0007]|nr:MAG: hypothetical protein TREMPRED_005446 [Tremellales sp. Tagirdzhanova-0007]